MALFNVQLDKTGIVAGFQTDGFEIASEPSRDRTASRVSPCESVSRSPAEASRFPDKRRLPRHPIPNRVGSSEVKITNSIDLCAENRHVSELESPPAHRAPRLCRRIDLNAVSRRCAIRCRFQAVKDPSLPSERKCSQQHPRAHVDRHHDICRKATCEHEGPIRENDPRDGRRFGIGKPR